jgi:hypothetical protein
VTTELHAACCHASTDFRFPLSHLGLGGHHASCCLSLVAAEELVAVLHLTPLVLRMAHILMAYATGAHAQAAPSTEHYSSLSPPALRNMILGQVDRREPHVWVEVGWSYLCLPL